MFLIPAVLYLPGFFERHFDSLNFFINLLPNQMEYGMYGVVYTQFAADFSTIIVTAVFAILVSKNFKHEMSQETSDDRTFKLQH